MKSIQIKISSNLNKLIEADDISRLSTWMNSSVSNIFFVRQNNSNNCW